MTRSKCVCGNNKEQMAEPIEDCDDLCFGSVLAYNDQHGTCQTSQCQNETHTTSSDLASGETPCACVVESPEGDGRCPHTNAVSASDSTGSDKINMINTPKCMLGGSPPNGCINMTKCRTLDDNGIVKVTEHSIRECLADAENGSPNACASADMSTEEATSNITTDSEECPTPSTDKTQLSDSESPGEEGSKAGSPDVSTLCDDLANTSISNPAQKQPETADVKLGIDYVVYESELQMKHIMRLITKDLSEPYSIYTYRYFIHNWPKLCFLAMDSETGKCVGAIVCKLDVHKKLVRRGYIAMLAVDQQCRRRGIGSHLVLKAIKAMVDDECDEVVLETEITNKAALHLYENLGFVRDKRLFRYYLNGVDALRLKLWLK